MSSPARFRQMPTLTTITKLPSGKPKISTRNVISQRRQRLNGDQAKDPQQVAQAVNFLQDDVRSASDAIRNDPELGAIRYVAVPVTGGATLLVTHNFGRPFQGYRVTRTYLGASIPIQLQDGVLPKGISVNTTVAVVPSGNGTIDFRVW